MAYRIEKVRKELNPKSVAAPAEHMTAMERKGWRIAFPFPITDSACLGLLKTTVDVGRIPSRIESTRLDGSHLHYGEAAIRTEWFTEVDVQVTPSYRH
jgi:hypothetical protein